MEFDAYKQINAINATAIKSGVVSMLNMHSQLTGPGKETTPAMRMGTLLHTAVLEPDRFTDKVYVWEGKRDKRNKLYAAFSEGKNDFWILTEKERDICEAVQASVWAKTEAYRLIEGADIERTIQWEDPACGLCKARLDIVKPGMICDFKTTANIQPDKFAVDCAKMYYHLQMGFYARGYEQLHGTFPIVYIIAAEKTPPYDCAVFVADDFTLQAGACRAVEIACQYQDSVDRGEFLGVDRGEILPWILPSWAEGMQDVPDQNGPGSWTPNEMNGGE